MCIEWKMHIFRAISMNKIFSVNPSTVSWKEFCDPPSFLMTPFYIEENDSPPIWQHVFLQHDLRVIPSVVFMSLFERVKYLLGRDVKIENQKNKRAYVLHPPTDHTGHYMQDVT